MSVCGTVVNMMCLEVFLGRLFAMVLFGRSLKSPILPLPLLKADVRICLDIATYKTDVNPIRRHYLYPPSLHRSCRGHGILTVCPSGAAFAIPLGPTNPWLINIAKETLCFRRAGISPALRLLVPAFSLPNAPAWLAPLPSLQMGTLSYHVHRPKPMHILSFGTTFKPRLSSARNLSMSELLRFLSRMAASKPTSSLSVKFYLLVMYLT